MPAPRSLVGISVSEAARSAVTAAAVGSAGCRVNASVRQKQGYQWPEQKAFRRTSVPTFCAVGSPQGLSSTEAFSFSSPAAEGRAVWTCLWGLVALLGTPEWQTGGAAGVGKTCPCWWLSCQKKGGEGRMTWAFPHAATGAQLLAAWCLGLEPGTAPAPLMCDFCFFPSCSPHTSNSEAWHRTLALFQDQPCP